VDIISAPRPRLKVESIPMRPMQASQIYTMPSSMGMRGPRPEDEHVLGHPSLVPGNIGGSASVVIQVDRDALWPQTELAGFEGVICQRPGNCTTSAPQRALASIVVWIPENPQSV
jgi:hypothetical protein